MVLLRSTTVQVTRVGEPLGNPIPAEITAWGWVTIGCAIVLLVLSVHVLRLPRGRQPRTGIGTAMVLLTVVFLLALMQWACWYK